MLRQASDQELERYITHAHQKVRAQAREERAGKEPERFGSLGLLGTLGRADLWPAPKIL
jgi:hypothetical protein